MKRAETIRANDSRIEPVGNKAVIYLHTDTAEQGYDVVNNVQIVWKRVGCERKASELGLLIVGEYVDIGTSARTLNRPGLQSCLRELEDGTASYLLVDNNADLARPLLVSTQLKRKFNELGVTCLSTRETVDVGDNAPRAPALVAPVRPVH